MSDIVEGLRGRADRYRQLWGNAAYYTEGDALFDEEAADTITALRAELERKDAALANLIETNNALIRKCDPFLSSADLKAVDRHCDWVAFGHAYRAMLNVRAALSPAQSDSKEERERKWKAFNEALMYPPGR